MGLTYYTGFDLAQDAPGFSLAITRSTYSYTITIANFATTTFYQPFADGDGYVSFVAALQVAIRAAATTAGDATAADWVVTWMHDMLGIEIGHGVNAWTAVLSADAQHVLGMAANLGSAAAHASTVRPYYAIRPAVDSFKDDAPDQESDGAAPDEEETDDGDSSGLTRTAFPVYHDLTQLYEPKAACEPVSALAAVPWTWRAAVMHLRIHHPFVVITAPDSQSTITYTAADVWARLKLRKDGAVWRPQRSIARPALDTHYHVPLRCRVLERLS